MFDSLVDRIYEEMKKKMPLPIPEKMAKEGIERVLAALEPLGIHLLYGGGREKLAITPSSFFCPHCGKHQPPTGINIQSAEVPGMGIVGVLTIFCGVPSCLRIINQALVPPMPEKKSRFDA